MVLASASSSALPVWAASLPVLSDDEIRGLLYMREEEKLARDVYAVQSRQWQLAVFDNIRSSEVNHMAAIANLLSRYGLDDPAAGNGEGEFENQTLQNLYNALIVQAERSLADALLVGTAIEEIDILDLKEHLSLTDESPIQQVYGNLLEGSYNHLRAFVSQLENRTNASYQPQYLSIDVYEQIMAGKPGYRDGAGNGGQGQGGGNSN